MTLAMRLKKMRNQIGLNQKELAEILGIHPQRVSDIERGKIQNMKGEELGILENKYHINSIWLSTGRGEVFNNSGTIVGVNNGHMHIGSSKEKTYPKEILDIADYLYYNATPALFPIISETIKEIIAKNKE